jgi:hypothetical protein
MTIARGRAIIYFSFKAHDMSEDKVLVSQRGGHSKCTLRILLLLSTLPAAWMLGSTRTHNLPLPQPCLAKQM